MKSKKRIVIVSQLDPIYMVSFFDEFFKLIDLYDLEIDLEIFDMPNFNENKFRLIKRLIRFYGVVDFFKLFMIYIKEIFFNFRLSNFKIILDNRKIKCHKLNSVNENDFLKYLKNLKPDFVISLSAPGIFKDPILSISNIQFINLHCAPLPSYKGMMPNFWQKLNNEIYSAITIHEISGEIDCGKILYQKKIDLIQTDSLHNTIIRGKKLSAIALLEYLFKDKINPNQFKGKDSYFSFPRKEDVYKFKKFKKKFF